MAQQEIIDHTKEALSIIGDKKKSFWHRTKEFLLEITIIVFAVTVSIWFHDINENRHQQKEVKEFLSGLKTDLVEDITEMEGDKMQYAKAARMVNYILNLKKGKSVNTDTLKRYSNFFLSFVQLTVNSARLEGFKSSGKIGLIKNHELQQDILSFYQEEIHNLLFSTERYNIQKEKLMDHISQNRKRVTDTTSNLADVMGTNEVHFRMQNLLVAKVVVQRYDIAIEKARKIVSEIEKEYSTE
jgi:hypothetical protein